MSSKSPNCLALGFVTVDVREQLTGGGGEAHASGWLCTLQQNSKQHTAHPCFLGSLSKDVLWNLKDTGTGEDPGERRSLN